MEIVWKFQKLEAMSTRELYAILQLRQEVFVVEQQCIYQDLDNLDLDCFHLSCWDNADPNLQLAGYLRIMEAEGGTIRIGRVVIPKPYRGSGLGRLLFGRGLEIIEQRWTHPIVRISAQQYLTEFYENFGFRVCSAPYLEDGIPHIAMQKQL